MFRRMFVAAAAVVLVAFGVIAGEHKGAITKYEAGKSLTIKVKKEEKTLKIAKDAKVDDAVAKKLEQNWRKRRWLLLLSPMTKTK